jgi:hypothetical protein
MTSYLSRTALISFPLFLQEYFTEVRGGRNSLLYKNSTDFLSIAVRWRNGRSMNAATPSSMRNSIAARNYTIANSPSRVYLSFALMLYS